MEIAIETKLDEWEEWNLRYGSVFQSKHFAEAIRKSGMDVELITLKENNKLVGGCFAFIPFKNFPIKYFTDYRIVNGPILQRYDLDILSKTLDFIEQRAKSHHAINLPLKLPFTNITDFLQKKEYTVSNNAPTFSFHIALTANEEKLWNELDKKTRNSIRKAEKNNVIVREIKNKSELKIAYSLYMTRAKSKKNWIPYPYSFFESLYDNMKSELIVLIAEHQNKIIAEAMFLKYNKSMLYFNNGSSPEYWDLCANTLLLWEGIKLAKSRGCMIFDSYGTSDGKNKGDINYGLYQFKSGFGGKLIETATFANKIISPLRKKTWDKLIVPIALPIYKLWAGGFDE